jgi:NADPH:quinone reductase-like Zn-dependent oxidoreductase
MNKKKMNAVVTLGTGGYEQLSFREVDVPNISNGEVLIKVFAAGVNNTEINTRLGWYSSSFSASTNETQVDQEGDRKEVADGGWNEKTPFPFIQGTDCCGEVVEVFDDKYKNLLGKRVIVRPCLRVNGDKDLENIWMASDFDGAFAEYVKVSADDAFVVECDWTNEELASIPCTYGTSENMINRAVVKSTDTVLVMGASGGIGTASIQLAKRRGARVIGVCSRSKKEAVLSLGADQVITREESILKVLGGKSVDVVVDNVGGESFPELIEVLVRGGKYVSSGAVAGPIVQLDLRSFYLKDITLIGCTGWDLEVFPNLVRYIERGEIRPVVWKIFPLKKIVDAQKEFLRREHAGKIVITV